MSTPVSNSFWEQVDGALVINLDARSDRWTQFQEATREIVPAEKLHRFSACVGKELPGFGQRPWFRGGPRDRTWAGRAGCLLSHRRALLQARARGWRTVLLLEDDAEFAPEFTRVTEQLTAALRDINWQVCYLGFTEPWWPGRNRATLGAGYGLHQIQGCTTTHAYLVREAARDWIIAQLPDETRVWPWLATHRAIDRWYQRRLGLEFPITCVSPSIVNQSASASDIVTNASAIALTSAPAAPAMKTAVYYAGHAYRRISIRVSGVGDALRGLARRGTGF